VFAADNLTSQSAATTTHYPFEFEGVVFHPGKGWWETTQAGMNRLAAAGRLKPIGNSLMYRRFFDDFPLSPTNNVWRDVLMTGFSEQKTYVVQTSSKVIERCLLMTTEPGDLVLDPTSGNSSFLRTCRTRSTPSPSHRMAAISPQRSTTAPFASGTQRTASRTSDLVTGCRCISALGVQMTKLGGRGEIARRGTIAKQCRRHNTRVARGVETIRPDQEVRPRQSYLLRSDRSEPATHPVQPAPVRHADALSSISQCDAIGRLPSPSY
jgi:hypothetical protein